MGITIPEQMLDIAEKDPTKEIFVFYDHKMKRTSITFAELYTMASRYAHLLKEKGLKLQQAVCVSLPSSIELAVATYGVILAGGMPVCCEVVQGKELVFPHTINKCEAQIVVVRTNSDDLTWKAIKDKVTLKDKTCGEIKDDSMPGLKTVLLANRDEGANNVQDFLTMVRNYKETFVNRDIKETDICGLFLTSGTTGMPKLAMQSHLAMSEGSAIENGFIPDLEDKRFYSNAPWSWAVASPFDIMCGHTRIAPEYWTKPADVARLYTDILEKESINNAFLTPPEIEGILKYWDLKKKKIVKNLCVAGYPVSHAMCGWFLGFVENLWVRYGCSELISISINMINDINNYKDFDCGKPCKGTRVKALDENLKELPRGKPGRLLLNSWGVFKGYMNDKDKTDEALTKDGWFLTSDAGFIDEKGHLVVVGRYDYVITHKNNTYYPSVIEKPIQKLPGVKQAVIVPLPNKENHHNVCACVVRQPNSQVTEADVKKVVADKVKEGSTNMVEPQHVIFLDEIKVNERGKMNTNEIIKIATKQING